MDITLHIGAHRTATTTLQTALARHRPVLRAAGVEVWGPDRTRAGLFMGLIVNPQKVTPVDDWQAGRTTGLIRAEVRRLADTGIRRIVVSEENMLGSVHRNLQDCALYPLADDRLLRLGPAFAGLPLRIVMGIRSYDTYWASALMFGILQRQHRLPPPDMIARLAAQPRRWREVVADVARVFPQADIRVWHYEDIGDDPLAQIAVLTAGVTLRGDGARTEHCNASPRRDTLRRMLRLSGQTGGTDSLPPGDGAWMPFVAETVARMQDQYCADLDWLEKGADGLARGVRMASYSADEALQAGSPRQGDRDDPRPARLG